MHLFVRPEPRPPLVVSVVVQQRAVDVTQAPVRDPHPRAVLDAGVEEPPRRPGVAAKVLLELIEGAGGVVEHAQLRLGAVPGPLHAVGRGVQEHRARRVPVFAPGRWVIMESVVCVCALK